ncbi:hypothetical protein FDP41_006881 [Naegleria fowleri]|uniref:Uncharacterized protein n=1 Tax=Naegleria fowleri TaxID=5763 RepID=A0A6A5BIJ5_NAEFO|nr:uncharacterized protein FDP41_006881 [Naegleria fowleri]KAF0974271.1 hypothetical protein FDP41_006881 [Naegleria fowleri]CAG4718010.1 unnamed protein product [Naegleria fowleri]
MKKFHKIYSSFSLSYQFLRHMCLRKHNSFMAPHDRNVIHHDVKCWKYYSTNTFGNHNESSSPATDNVSSSQNNHQNVDLKKQSRAHFQLMHKLGQLSSRAITNQKLSKFEEALEDYKKIIELQPDSVFALLQIGHLLAFDLKRKQEAIPYFEQVIQLTTPDFGNNGELQPHELDEIRMLEIEYQPKANYFLTKVYLEMVHESSSMSVQERTQLLEKAKVSIDHAVQLLHEVREDLETPIEVLQPFEQLQEQVYQALRA